MVNLRDKNIECRRCLNELISNFYEVKKITFAVNDYEEPALYEKINEIINKYDFIEKQNMCFEAYAMIEKYAAEQRLISLERKENKI